MSFEARARRASDAASDGLVEQAPDVAAGAVRAIVAAQRELAADVTLAAKVGREVFPPAEAELITDLIRRDLPYYDPAISPAMVDGMNRFARDLGILHDPHVPYERVVATRFAPLWARG